jgi:hypothetical protein
MNESRLVDRRVSYTLEHDGHVYVVENVPARVDEETGEQFFAPATVERLHEVILGEQKPDRPDRCIRNGLDSPSYAA